MRGEQHYDNIRLITNIFKLKMAKFESTLRYVVDSPSIRGLYDTFWPIIQFFILKWVTFIAVLLMSVRKCSYMYDYIRLCTDILRYDAQQCTTMYTNVRQKILPYDRIFVAPKSFTCKTFFKFAALPTKTYDSLQTTAINHDNTRKTTTFLIRTLSHLRIRMWETSITCYFVIKWVV